MKNPLSWSKSYFSGRNLAKFRPQKIHSSGSGGPNAAKGYSIKQMAIDAIEQPMQF
jgi:hypothetical protein